MPVTVSKTSNLQSLNLRLKALEQSEVYVGIPQENSSRPGEEINNAELLFIHEHGSPINNLPAREVLRPALQANKKLIADQLSIAAKAVLAGDQAKANRELEKTGILAANAAKRWFTDDRNGWQPLSLETIRRKGSSQILIDTGEMRRAISWEVKPVENLPKDRWKKSELGSGGKFGSETDVATPEIAKKVAKSTVESAEKVVESVGEGIAEAGETLGGAAELLML